MKGVTIRSRVNWLSSGVKPSKYFCKLEKQNFLEKTIKRLTNKQGEIISDQKQILEEIEIFYDNLFESKDNLELNENDIETLTRNLHIPKLEKNDKEKLEEKLSTEEIGVALFKLNEK